MSHLRLKRTIYLQNRARCLFDSPMRAALSEDSASLLPIVYGTSNLPGAETSDPFFPYAHPSLSRTFAPIISTQGPLDSIFMWENRMAKSFVAYLRVSTDKQGADGNGIDAQSDSVARYVADSGAPLSPLTSRLNRPQSTTSRTAPSFRPHSLTRSGPRACS